MHDYGAMSDYHAATFEPLYRPRANLNSHSNYGRSLVPPLYSSQFHPAYNW